MSSFNATPITQLTFAWSDTESTFPTVVPSATTPSVVAPATPKAIPLGQPAPLSSSGEPRE